MNSSDDELYQERILDHYEQPYHRGRCPAATHCHEDDNPLCGDVVRVELAVDNDRRIREAWFNGDRLLHQPGRGVDADASGRREIAGRSPANLAAKICSACSAPGSRPIAKNAACWVGACCKAHLFSPVADETGQRKSDGHMSTAQTVRRCRTACATIFRSFRIVGPMASRSSISTTPPPRSGRGR